MKVDFLNHEADLQVLVLGRLGFSTEFIASKTNLTTSQVLYRLQRGNVKRSEYRSGKSQDVFLMLGAILPSVRRRVQDSFSPKSKIHV